MRKPEIAGKLVDYVEERIVAGEYPIDSRIPSVRRLAAKFNLSYYSAIQGINYLCEKKQLYKISKQGIYVNEHSLISKWTKPGKYKIVFFITTSPENDMQSLWYATLLGMSEAAVRRGHSLILTQMPVDDSCNEVLERELHDADGGVIFNTHPWAFRPLKRKIPVAGVLFDHNLENTISIFNLDPVESARTAVGYFLERGIRHVVIISSPRDVFMTRGRIFELYWRETGGSSVICNEPPMEYQMRNGYFFTSDHICQKAYEYYHQKSGQLPDKSAGAVLSLDGKRLLNPDYYHFPTIALDWKMLGQCILEEILQRIEQPFLSVKSINLRGTLSFQELSQ